MKNRCLICKAFAPRNLNFTCKRCGALNMDARNPAPFGGGFYTVGASAASPIRVAYRVLRP